MSPCASAIISRLFQVVWLEKCVLTIVELNCYERFEDLEKKTENVSPGVHVVRTTIQ